MNTKNDPERTATAIVDAAYRIHVNLGPGLLECAYEDVLVYELTKGGHTVVRQKRFGFYYDGVLIRRGLKPDLVVDDCVIVEVKASESTPRVYKRQLLTYLRALDLRLGLLLNFGCPTMKEGTARVVNHHDEAGSPLRIALESSASPGALERVRGWFRRSRTDSKR